MDRRIIERKVFKKAIKAAINKFLSMVVVFLLGMISVKINPDLQPMIREKVFESSFSFTKLQNIYQKYFGSLYPKEKKEEVLAVFQENPSIKQEEIPGGVKLTVSDSSSVSAVLDGLIVFVGVQDNKNTVIIDQVDGVTAIYQNVLLENYKLYDYIEKGQEFGKVDSNEYSLFFQKDGVEVSYKEYI